MAERDVAEGDWAEQQASPAEDEFEAMVGRALGRIPEPFASQLDSVAIVIDDQASPAQLASVRARGLFGLYQGVPRTIYGADQVPLPSKITIFRGALEWFYPDPAARERAVEDTVFHEVAHHFGISDARLRELQKERG